MADDGQSESETSEWESEDSGHDGDARHIVLRLKHPPLEVIDGCGGDDPDERPPSC